MNFNIPRILNIKNIFVLLVFSAVVLVGIYFQVKEEEGRQTPSGAVKVEMTKPGESIEEVKEKLGEPKETINQQGSITLNYQSSSQAFDHQIVAQDDEVKFIKEIITIDDEDKNASRITEAYGETEHVLYGPHSMAGFHLYVYPDNGIAYIASEQGLLLEVWYFEPTTLEDFKSRWATDYSEEKPEQQ